MATSIEEAGITSSQRKNLSNTFLALAWVIEIAAAGVGLTLAIARLEDDAGLQGIVAALPFFAVAIMELTKIPLATVIYHTAAKRWRYGFTVALGLSMLITFETFVIGFDTYQAELEKQIKPTRDAVKEIQLQISSAENNIIASDAISQGAAKIDTEYKDRVTSINEKIDRRVEAYEAEKKAIDKKYEGNTKSIQGIVESLDEQLKDRNNRIADERKALRKDLETLANENARNSQSNRVSAQADIERLQIEKQQIREDTLKEKGQIRGKARADYEACEKTNRESIFGEDCSPIRRQEQKDLGELDEKERNDLDRINEDIRIRKQQLGGTGINANTEREESIRKKYDDRIKKLEADKTRINAEKAEKISELARVQGNYTRSDKAALARLSKSIENANAQRSKEQNEAKAVADQRRNRADGAKQDVAATTKQANELRKDLAPLCAKLNDVVSRNQVYRLAIQFHNVDDACDLKQEQLTRTQWIWYGSLAFVTSALGTTLAFAGLVIKYPPQLPKEGGIGGIVKGLFRRVNYSFALLHRRLRKPKIKEIPVDREVIKEVTKEVPVDRVVEKVVEVTKEVPVEKVVYRDIPREVVKRELVHVPLFTQDVKAVVKGD
jgi:hypothetical protein